MMEKRPKRHSATDKDYRDHKRQRRTTEKTVNPSTEESGSSEIKQIRQLYKDILEYKDTDDDDYRLCEAFMELPSKEDYPDYYDVIKNPISLDIIESNINNNQYITVNDLKADIELMINNAKKYNMKKSQIHEDALKIQKYVKNWTPPVEKTLLKIPGDAFNSKIKTIKLRAVNHRKRSVVKDLTKLITKKEFKKALELIEEEEDLDPNILVPMEMFGDKFTWSPIHAAAYYGDIKVTEALLEKGADVELHDTWHSATPLGWAAFGDKEKVAKLLIEKYNADKDAMNVHGQTAFDVVSDQEDPRWEGIFKEKKRVSESQQQNNQKTEERQPQHYQSKQYAPSQSVQQQQAQYNQQQYNQQKQQQQQQPQQQLLHQQNKALMQSQHMQGSSLSPSDPMHQMMHPQQQMQAQSRQHQRQIQQQMHPIHQQRHPAAQMPSQQHVPQEHPNQMFYMDQHHQQDPSMHQQALIQQQMMRQLAQSKPMQQKQRHFKPQDYLSPDNQMQPLKKRRGRPPKSETDAAAVRPIAEINLDLIDPVAIEVELFNAIRTHTDNLGRLYSEAFEDLPERREYPEYYSVIKQPRCLSEIASKMQKKGYPNLRMWMNDMILVFENALSFNEPGSRIFRDAKLLLRLLHRLKERILAKLNVPVSQEDELMHINISNRPFDMEFLSEDRRKGKRILLNKSRTQSMEPEQQIQQIQQIQQPPMNQYGLQPQPFMHHPHLPPTYNVSPLVAPPLQSSYDINTVTIPPFVAPFTNLGGIEQTPPAINMASTDYHALINNTGPFLDGIEVTSSSDNMFRMEFEGEFLAHSVRVPSKIETVDIHIKLPEELLKEEKRIKLSVTHNNMTLNSTGSQHWTTMPLIKSLNTIKITVVADVTENDGRQQMKTQVHHLFITYAW
ncbi:hypothetical protein BDB01DRAFT_769915 [Pilobolus umbonatus]|nr:hypothetical protein BDB01DRAFT_769915 [Pilobolus umbonatus]